MRRGDAGSGDASLWAWRVVAGAGEAAGIRLLAGGRDSAAMRRGEAGSGDASLSGKLLSGKLPLGSGSGRGGSMAGGSSSWTGAAGLRAGRAG